VSDDPLVPVVMPAVVVLLLNAEKQKGAPLTQGEVESIRNTGTCVMIPLPQVAAIQERRGYDDVDPERAWEEWQVVRKTLISDSPGQ